MGLVGRIEDVPLSEILQVVSRSQKNGTLVLNDGSGLRGVVIFDDGKVIQAATNDLRDSLGSLLFVKGLVDESGLRRALEIQRGPKLGMRLGQVLVEMNALTQETLEETIRKHIENLVCMLIQWERGSFSFETGRPALGEDLEAVTREFLLGDGLSTDYLLVESARQLDEMNRNGQKPAAVERPVPLDLLSPAEAAPLDRRRPVRVVTEYRPPEAAVPPSVGIQVGQLPAARAPAGTPPDHHPPRLSEKPRAGRSGAPGEAPSPGTGAASPAREMETLRAVSEEMRSMSTETGIAHLALRYAKSLASRAAMFRVTGDELAEIGRTGMQSSAGPPDNRGRKAKPPASGGSMFAAVIRDGTSKRGRLPEGSWDRAFVTELDGAAPAEFFLVPVLCEGKVAAVLYGDNGSDGGPLPAITGLEVMMQQAGLAMEKARLQERLREMQKPAPLRPAASH